MPKENDLEGGQDQGGKHGGQKGMPKPEPRPSDGPDQGIARDEKGQEQPRDKKRAQHVHQTNEASPMHQTNEASPSRGDHSVLSKATPNYRCSAYQFALPAELFLGILSTLSGSARSNLQACHSSICIAVVGPRTLSRYRCCIDPFGRSPDVCLEMPLSFPIEGAR